jgi:hypothetical protein
MSTDYSPLKTGLRGELIQPADAGYDEARKLYNAMIDKKPAAIAHCVDAADAMTCVNYARDNKILLAIRGGGHNGPGLGSCNDGLVIDLSAIKGIRVDPAAATAQVGGGCVWGDVDHATHAFGLAAASGIISRLSNRVYSASDRVKMHGRVRSRSCEQGKDHDLGEELLGSRSSIFSRWSLRQHDDGRRRCPTTPFLRQPGRVNP